VSISSVPAPTSRAISPRAESERPGIGEPWTIFECTRSPRRCVPSPSITRRVEICVGDAFDCVGRRPVGHPYPTLRAGLDPLAGLRLRLDRLRCWCGYGRRRRCGGLRSLCCVARRIGSCGLCKGRCGKCESQCEATCQGNRRLHCVHLGLEVKAKKRASKRGGRSAAMTVTSTSTSS
jgi:hypothetical protein